MIWCLGMYASGSTWLYNAVRQTAEVVRPDMEVRGTYTESLGVLQALPGGVCHVVKTHDLGQAETDFLALNAARIVISIRDPRDAVTSLMQYMRHGFPKAIDKVERSAAICAHFATDERAEVFSYDAGFTDDAATFDRLAGTFGGRLSAAGRTALFEGSRRAAIEWKIARLEELPNVSHDPASGDIVDLDSQWHRHHAGRTGEIGRWQRLLPPEAVRHIEQRMERWMRQFGFEIWTK